VSEFFLEALVPAGVCVTVACFAYFFGRRKGIENLIRIQRMADEHQRAEQGLQTRVKHAEQEISRLEHSLAELPEIAHGLSACRKLTEVPQRALDLVEELFDPKYAVFYRTRCRDLVSVALMGRTDISLGHVVKPGEGIVGWTAVKQIALTPEDVQCESAEGRSRISRGSKNLDFSHCLPVLDNGRTIGVILVGPTQRKMTRARDTARTIAMLASGAMTSAAMLKQQKQLARTDGLTGLPNKIEILQRLINIVGPENESTRTLSVFLFDIDHFKHYNDTNGHIQGDELLRLLSELLRKSMREEEVVGRYGGEEFLMVMPDMEKRNALKAAERIRRLVAKHKFPFGEKQPLERITVSGGVAHYPTDAQDAEELLRHADQALYRAKGEGRNRVLAHVLPDLPSSDFCDPFVREVLDDLPEELLVEQVKEN